MGRSLSRSEVRARRDGLWDGVGDRSSSSWAAIHDRLLCSDIARRQDLDAAIAREDDAGQRARRRAIQRVAARRRDRLRRLAGVQG
jgi:hypothetical protein